MRLCQRDGCGRPHMARGWCAMHYARWRRRGTPDVYDPRCLVEGCGQPHMARGMCSRHYGRWRYRQGASKHPPCSVDGCGGFARSRGWCDMHYARWKKAGKPDRLNEVMAALMRICRVEGCDQQHRARGYCKTHYDRMRERGLLKTRPFRTGCRVLDCPNKHKARGLCARHYEWWSRHGVEPRTATCLVCGRPGRHMCAGCYDGVCQLEGCGRSAPAGRRWCGEHSLRRNRPRAPQLPDGYGLDDLWVCQADGCEESSNLGWCPAHYRMPSLV